MVPSDIHCRACALDIPPKRGGSWSIYTLSHWWTAAFFQSCLFPHFWSSIQWDSAGFRDLRKSSGTKTCRNWRLEGRPSDLQLMLCNRAGHQCPIPMCRAPTTCRELCYMPWLQPWTSEKWSLTMWRLLEANSSYLSLHLFPSLPRTDGRPPQACAFGFTQGSPLPSLSRWLLPCPMSSSPSLPLSVPLTQLWNVSLPSSALPDIINSDE